MRRRWPSTLCWSGPRRRPTAASNLKRRRTSHVGAARMPELDPPGPCAATPGQHNPRRTCVVSSPRLPLLHAAGAGSLCPRLRPARALRSRRRAPRAAGGSVHRRGSRPSGDGAGRRRGRMSPPPGVSPLPHDGGDERSLPPTVEHQGASASY